MFITYDTADPVCSPIVVDMLPTRNMVQVVLICITPGQIPRDMRAVVSRNSHLVAVAALIQTTVRRKRISL